ncbi:hypothetical protein TWF696_009737 [Orbilia brochopaga]|uniref:Uncharacterized protein n=1 Tax=Orbilia brochopaga TaxID=3140254 RepID=A0AAV9UEI6_9PEZI
MPIEIQIRPPTVYIGENTQPCGSGNNRVCWIPGSKITTGLCGTWLGLDNYCCTYIDSEFNTTNACGTIAGIHDTKFADFGTAATVEEDSCPNKSESVINRIRNEPDQCCPYQDVRKLDVDFAAVFLHEAPEGSYSSNLTGIRCLNLTVQGLVEDDGSSTYSGNKVGNSGGSSGGSTGDSSSSGKTNSGATLSVTKVFGGALFFLAVIAQFGI